MKKYIFPVLCVILAAILIGCSTNDFEVSGDKLVDKKTNIPYTFAPDCYVPIEMSTKVYGVIDKVTLYEIVGANPEHWLSESTGTVLYSGDVQLPTIGEMNISRTELLIDTSSSVELDAELSSTLIAAYIGNENISRPMPPSDGIVHVVSIRFSDSSIGIAYLLTYMELTEDYIVADSNYGRYFLFNRFEERCVAVGNLLGEYLK